MKYGELNLGQVEAMVNKLGGMDGVRRFLSDELVIKEREYKSEVFRVTVDYTQALDQIIKAGEYERVDANITSEHFPARGTGQKELEITLFYFNRTISSDEAIAEMEKTGYRPASIEELLTLVVAKKILRKQFPGPLVALGSVWWISRGVGNVPYQWYWSGNGEDLSLQRFDDHWSTSCRFAAVRK